MGITGREIARKLKITHGSVQCNLKKSIQHGIVKKFAKSGRLLLIDGRKSLLLIRNSNDSPKITVRQLLVELRLNKICSIDTVKRQLCRNGLFGRVAARKLLLTQKHVNKRKRWC